MERTAIALSLQSCFNERTSEESLDASGVSTSWREDNEQS